MSTKPYRKPRQSLLCFPTTSKAVQPPTETEVEAIPRPRSAVELPTELWSRILSDQSTIVLKGFRLVCREWSRVGALWLFRTVYLDCWDKSWRRLEQLAGSPYAKTTTKIVWTPLALSRACLDSTIWQQTYPNLNYGISHTKSLQLHNIYRKVYQKYKYSWMKRSSSRRLLERWKCTIACFSGCRTLTMEDDLELEARCKDPFLRKRIQSDDVVLQKPAVWGKNVRWWSDDQSRADLTEVFQAFLLLDVIDQSTNILRLELFLWEANFFNFLDRFKLYEKEPPVTAITEICIRIKWPNTSAPWIVDQSYLTRRSRNSDLIAIALKWFPDPCNIIVSTILAEPGPIFLEEYRQALHQDESPQFIDHEEYSDDDNVQILSSSFSSHYSTLSSLEARREARMGLPRDLLFKLRTEPSLDPLIQAPKLTSITFDNITLNTRALIFWLCNQTQIPQVTTTIKLTGDIILYGLNEALFKQILRSINVKLLYDPQRTCYYETAVPHPDSGNRTQTSFVQIPLSRSDYWRYHLDRGSRQGLYQTDVQVDSPQDLREPVVNLSGKYHHLAAPQFVHRPGEIETLILKHCNKDEPGKTYLIYYAYDLNSKFSFKWEYITDYPDDSLPLYRYVIAMAQVEFHPIEYEEEDYWEAERLQAALEEAAQNESDLETPGIVDDDDSEAQQQQDQAALLVYETELLRLDAQEDDIA